MVRYGMVRDGAGRDDVHSDWVDFKSKRADITTGTTRILLSAGCQYREVFTTFRNLAELPLQ